MALILAVGAALVASANAAVYASAGASVSYNQGGNDWAASAAELLDSIGSGTSPTAISASACATAQQSPINIVDQPGATNAAIYDNTTTMLNYTYPVVSSYLVEMNEHTMEVKFDLTNSTNTTGFGFTVPGFGYLPATQLHFHSPSEHTINGLHYPLEMHIVNQLVTYNATTGAYKAGVPAGVITVMFGYTPDNTPSAFLDSIFTGLSTTKNLTFEQYVTMAATNQYIAKNNSVENEVTGGALDLSGLLASSSPSSYYRYNGSLTTPACSQTVQFNILDAPLSVSYAQVVRFTNLLAAAQGGISRGADNRAPNPTTTKVVKSFM